jgi:cell division protein FtsB
MPGTRGGAGEDVSALARKRQSVAKRRSSNRPRKSRLALRWLGVGVLCLVGFLYYQPARTYFETRHTLAQRSAEVEQLAAQKRRLERLVAASTSNAALAREARRLGLVKPGEQLFIVKGIAKWQRRHGYARGDG